MNVIIIIIYKNICSMLIFLVSVILSILFIKIYPLHNSKKKSLSSLYIGISGCDTGLGRELTETLRKGNQAHVYPGYFLPDSSNGSNKLDVTNELSIDQFISILPENLNVFIHNAGIISSSFIEVTDINTYMQMMNVNFFGVVRLTKKLLPLLRKNNGTIIIISSVIMRMPSAGLAAYASSKAALSCYANALRKEVKNTGVSVILIEPGMINTGMVQRSLVELVSTFNNLPPVYKIEKSKLSTVKWLADHSTPSQKAAKIIIDIVTKKDPSSRYLIGLDAYVLDFMSYLPYTWSDWLLS
jgi:short-subunit dehydrogenase